MNDQEYLNNEEAQSKWFENKAIFNSPCLLTSSLNHSVTARPCAKSFQNERWAIYRHQHWGWKRGHSYSGRPIEGRKFYTLSDWQKNSRHFFN